MKQIPEAVRRNAAKLFWDIDPSTLDPVRHEDFILGRVLSKGDPEAVRAIRAEVGDEALRAFITRAPHRLDRRSLRFFQVVLSPSEVPCTAPPFPRSNARLFQP